ncbi:hypothetical protein [Methylomarinum vadi]|uniref:hypothetical protein n=1 Tax=Methylomarinum vadi TaxID=438855 RepID=UPI00068E3BD6|nr:hypothetical protein [Methylomarinum vadi]
MQTIQVIFQILLALYVIGATGVVQASFVDYYDVGNWTTNIDPFGSDASIDLSDAPNSITLISGNNGISYPGFLSNIDFSITAQATSTISFDWTYATNDSDGSAQWDPFFLLHNGDEYLVLSGSNAVNQTGHFEFDVQAGDLIGFRMQSLDSLFGSASTTISNFNTQAPVPAPGGLPLLAIALASLKAFRRKRS